MRVDGDRIGELEAGDAARIARGEARRAAVRGVHVEPEAARARASSASPATSSTEPVFVEPATAAIASGRSPAARSTATAAATGSAWSRNRSSDGTMTSVSSGKPSSASARLIEKCAWSET